MYTQPDILRVGVFVVDECDVNNAEVDGLVEAEMIRSRIERTYDRAAALGALWVAAECLTAHDTRHHRQYRRAACRRLYKEI